jgi:hypothetical protein
MFFHSLNSKEKVSVNWAPSPLPRHEGIANELGRVFLTADEKQEAQLAMYIRNFDGTAIVYGYFAMRAKGETLTEERFLDSSGKGVAVFDKFWRSIHESP